MRRLLLALAFVAGCGIPPAQIEDNQPRLPKKPDQETAEGIIQQEMAGHFNWSPNIKHWPEVQWVEGDLLTCRGVGWFEYWSPQPNGSCVEYTKPAPDPVTGKPSCKACLLGISFLGENLIKSNWAPEKLQGYHSTSLAHEYCHYFSWWATGAADDNHTGPCFSPGGYVDLTNRTLQSIGL